MQRITLLTIALLLAPTLLFGQQKQAPPEGGQPKNFNLPKRQMITLDNGLKASMVPYGTIPKATVSVVVRTGNMHEGPNEVWLSDLLAELLKEGTTSRTAAQLSEEVARMGGSLSISSTPTSMTFTGSVLSENVPALVQLLAEVVQSPRLPASEVDRLKASLKRQLNVQKAQPQSQANEKFLAAMFPDQPYGRAYPTEAMLDSYDLAKVRSFYEAQYGAQRTHVYVAGLFNPGAVESAVRKSFGNWKKGPAVSIPEARPAAGKGFSVIDRPGAPQSTILIGLPVIDPTHPDYVALQVTNALLGGSFASRITSNIRENKGYTYSPFSQVAPRYRSGTWAEQADVTTEHTEASLKEIISEVNKLQAEAPPKDELEGIQNYQAGIFVLQNSNPNGIIGQLSFIDFHGLDESYLTDYVKNVLAVTPQKVQEMARKYIRDEDMTLVVVGDQKKIDKQVESFKPTLSRPQSSK
jgi:predicted Zn-dependent peptidase